MPILPSSFKTLSLKLKTSPGGDFDFGPEVATSCWFVCYEQRGQGQGKLNTSTVFCVYVEHFFFAQLYPIQSSHPLRDRRKELSSFIQAVGLFRWWASN